MKSCRVFLTALLVVASVAAAAQAQKLEPIKPAPQPPPLPGAAAPPPAPVDPNAKPPKLSIEKLEFDAGTVARGQVVDAAFTVTNKGEGPLQIQRVQAACGCTVTNYDREVLPGKTGTIHANVNTQSFSGPIAKTVQVFTNDPNMSTFTLTVKADVKSILSVSVAQKQADGTETYQPRETEQVGLIFKGQKVEKEFLIKSEDGQAFQLTQVQTEDTNVRYEIVPSKDKLSARFKVMVPAEYPVGPITARFTLSTSHPKVPTLNVNVFGTIREPLTFYPKEVVFNGLAKDYIVQNPQDPALNKLVTVAYETAPELTVAEVTSSVPFLETSFEATAPNQRYSVKIHLNPEKVKVGEFEGKVTVKTNKQEIVIPVRGRVF